MRSRLRRDFSNEDGVSLVEMLVSLLIIGIVLSALANTLISSSASARQNEGLTLATQVATEEVENLQALPWNKVGLYAGDPGYTATALGGRPTVTIPAASPRDPLVPYPSKTINRGMPAPGRSYVVQTEVVWRRANRYKEFRVRVSWTQNGQGETLTLMGRRAVRSRDSQQASAPPGGFRITAFTVNTDPLYLDDNGRTTTSINPDLGAGKAFVINVDTSEAASGVTVTWLSTQTATLTEVAGSGGLKWSVAVDATAPSGFVHPHGSALFTATATRSSGNVSDTTAAHFLWSVRQTRVAVGGPTDPGAAIDPFRFCVNGNPRVLRDWVDLYFGIRGLGADDKVTFVRPGFSGPPTWNMVPVQSATNGHWFGARITPTALGSFDAVATSVAMELRWQRLTDGTSGVIPLDVPLTSATKNRC